MTKEKATTREKATGLPAATHEPGAVRVGRPRPNYDDVQWVALPVPRHRVVTNFEAEADGQTAEDIISQLLDLSDEWT